MANKKDPDAVSNEPNKAGAPDATSPEGVKASDSPSEFFGSDSENPVPEPTSNIEDAPAEGNDRNDPENATDDLGDLSASPSKSQFEDEPDTPQPVLSSSQPVHNPAKPGFTEVISNAVTEDVAHSMAPEALVTSSGEFILVRIPMASSTPMEARLARDVSFFVSEDEMYNEARRLNAASTDRVEMFRLEKVEAPALDDQGNPVTDK